MILYVYNGVLIEQLGSPNIYMYFFLFFNSLHLQLCFSTHLLNNNSDICRHFLSVLIAVKKQKLARVLKVLLQFLFPKDSL